MAISSDCRILSSSKPPSWTEFYGPRGPRPRAKFCTSILYSFVQLFGPFGPTSGQSASRSSETLADAFYAAKHSAAAFGASHSRAFCSDFHFDPQNTVRQDPVALGPPITLERNACFFCAPRLAWGRDFSKKYSRTQARRTISASGVPLRFLTVFSKILAFSLIYV